MLRTYSRSSGVQLRFLSRDSSKLDVNALSPSGLKVSGTNSVIESRSERVHGFNIFSSSHFAERMVGSEVLDRSSCG